MAPSFARATRRRARLRLALVGPSGSGKTFTALALAKHLGGPIAVVDSERGSASKYADHAQLGVDFDVLELESHAPQTYTAAIRAAIAGGYRVLIIDSLSHAWMGRDGALEQVDRLSAVKRNNFAAWGEVTPAHNEMVDAILTAPLHVIVTMRVKMAYVVEPDERGKQVPKKVGLQPVQREGLEYEFDVVGDLSPENVLAIGKSRCSALAGKTFARPGREVAEALCAWLDGGDVEVAPAPAIVHRDPKPENAISTPAPAAAPVIDLSEAQREQYAREHQAIMKYASEWTRVRNHDQLDALCRKLAAIGGRNRSEHYQLWFDEMRAQTIAAIGPRPQAPGVAKVVPTAARTDRAKEVAS